MTDDTTLMRSSLEAILLFDDTFPARFYEILFERHPELRALFQRNSPGAQRKMFAQKLVALVDALEDPNGFAAEVVLLSRSHADYGVTPETYPWVRDAMLDTLAEGLGEDFTPAHREAWSRVWDRISTVMIASRR